MPPAPEPLTAEAADAFKPRSLAPDYVAQLERLETVIPAQSLFVQLQRLGVYPGNGACWLMLMLAQPSSFRCTKVYPLGSASPCERYAYGAIVSPMTDCRNLQPRQLLLEAQQLQDVVLEARCRMAVTANRLVRLDNPIAAAHLAGMQARCTPVVSSSCMLVRKDSSIRLYCVHGHWRAQHKLPGASRPGDWRHTCSSCILILCCCVMSQARAEQMLRKCED